MLKQPVLLTVSQLNRYLKARFDEDVHLESLYLSGEISNFTNHYQSGHLYFSLKDDTAAVRAVMFAGQAARLRFRPANGMRVLVRGRVSVYETTGQYQVYVEEMQPDGIGALHLAFEQRKEKLQKEGLFDSARKKPIPPFPERIGVITSPTGAAVQDILQILERRYPIAKVVFLPVQVQGDGAAEQIAAAIAFCNRQKEADVLIVGRGGGSIEDLWAFNEEIVARAIAASEIPVLSAVGHETDTTIADLVSDLRAPTPSAAAELATPDQAELLAYLEAYPMQLRQKLERRLEQLQQQLDTLVSSHYFRQPDSLISEQKALLAEQTEKMNHVMQQKIQAGQMELANYAGFLDGLSPLKNLQRGYAVVTSPGGKPIRSVQGIKPKSKLTVRMQDGTIDCVAANVYTQEGVAE